MDGFSVLALAFAIGVMTGLRSLTAPAAVSWAARAKWIHLEPTWLAFLGYSATPYILTILAAGELVLDKLPSTPSRKAPGPFAGRVVLGALCGAALCATAGHIVPGAVLGALGGMAGTFGGYEARRRLVAALGVPDFVVAVAEDVVAIGGSLFVVSRFAS